MMSVKCYVYCPVDLPLPHLSCLTYCVRVGTVMRSSSQYWDGPPRLRAGACLVTRGSLVLVLSSLARTMSDTSSMHSFPSSHDGEGGAAEVQQFDIEGGGEDDLPCIVCTCTGAMHTVQCHITRGGIAAFIDATLGIFARVGRRVPATRRVAAVVGCVVAAGSAGAGIAYAVSSHGSESGSVTSSSIGRAVQSIAVVGDEDLTQGSDELSLMQPDWADDYDDQYQ
nr:hypothetical protein 1 [signal crayfish associated toti-like virus 1]